MSKCTFIYEVIFMFGSENYFRTKLKNKKKL